MSDWVKLAKDAIRWLLLMAYIPALNFAAAYILKRYVRDRRTPLPPKAEEKEKNAGRRIDYYRIYLTLTAFVLSLAAVLFGRSLKLMVLLYLLAVSLLALLVVEFFRIRRARASALASGPMSSKKSPHHGKRILSIALAVLVPALGLIGTVPGLVNAARWWHTVVTSLKELNIFPVFTDQMHVGDIGDVVVRAAGDGYQFSYKPEGRGPHESEFKYLNGALNPAPAGFGGVIFLNDQLMSEPGRRDKDGMDLSSFCRSKITLEAHTLDGTAIVKFVIGGINWSWDETTKTRVLLRYPDTMPKRELGTEELTPNWREYEFDLKTLGLQPEDFKRVIGGIGWVMTWTSPPQPNRTSTIEVRKARYIK